MQSFGTLEQPMQIPPLYQGVPKYEDLFLNLGLIMALSVINFIKKGGKNKNKINAKIASLTGKVTTTDKPVKI